MLRLLPSPSPQDKEGDLPAFLCRLKEESPALGVTDLHVALTSLEEVFLTIARQAEMEGGSGTREVELEDGRMLTVPLGIERARHPVTGEEYDIKWAQDESGNLQILYARPVAV